MSNVAQQPETNAPQSVTEQLNKIQDTLKTIVGSNLNPLKILNTLYDIDNQAMKVAKSMGLTADNAQNITKNISGAVFEVRKLGGSFEDIIKTQIETGEALGRNLILSKDIYQGFYATTKVTGQEAKTLVTAFKDIGMSTYDITKQMETVVGSARAIGVNTKIVSDTVVKNIGMLNMYNFKDGVEGLAKMAAQATNLRIDMSKSFDFAEKVFNPEGAIETAAALQRLGVAQSDLLDPLRLMDLSQNNPEELQNQLVEMTKQFVELNEKGQFQIMPGEQRRLREISKELNISYDQLTRMAIGSSELEDKLKRISLPDFMSEDQKKMIANMAEMKDGDYVITVKGEEKSLEDAVKLFQQDEKLFEQFMKDQSPKTMEELAREQLSFVEKIAADVNSLVGRVPFAMAGGDSSMKFLEKASDGFTNITTSVNKFIGSQEEITKTFESTVNFITTKYGDDMTKLYTNTESVIENFADDIKNILPKSIVTAFEILKNKGLVGSLKETLQVDDFIKLPGQTIQPLPEDTLFGGTGFEEMINRIASVTTIQKNTNETTTSQINKNTTAEINVNFKIDAPPQIDTNQIMLMLNTNDFKQTIIKTVADAFSPDETSPVKKMNSFTRS